MSHSCFVCVPGLFESSFVGDNNNINVFTKILILMNKLRVTVAYRLTLCFPPKRNHNLMIRDRHNMDRCSGLEHTNTFYRGLGPQRIRMQTQDRTHPVPHGIRDHSIP